MNLDSPAYTWANLKSLRLEPGDLLRAAAWFLEKAGQPPAAVAINPGLLDNPRNGLAQDIGQLRAGGIPVLPGPGGLLAWEVWLYPASEAPKPRGAPVSLSAPSFEGRGGVVKSPACPNHRPRVLDGVTEGRIRALGAQGKGARVIRRHLEGLGVAVSTATISRRLRELQQGSHPWRRRESQRAGSDGPGCLSEDAGNGQD